MINNIDKAVQASKIEKKKHEYYKLKELQEKLPKRLKNAEIAYYKEGGCNLNDPSDTKQCGLEYYLDIKRQERIKALESFTNSSTKNDEEAEEINNYSFFDNLKLSNLFNKTVEGLVVNDDKKTCDWTKNTQAFKDCNNHFTEINNITVYHPCKYNNDLKLLIDELYEYRKIKKTIGDQTKSLNKISKLSSESVQYMDNGIKKHQQQSMADYRNATFYDKHSESYINTINTLKSFYWLVLVLLTAVFLYKRYYEKDAFGYVVISLFTLVPLFLLKPFANFIMLNVKRYHFIDTLYFTIAIASVLLVMFLYFITSQGAAKLEIPMPEEGANAIAKSVANSAPEIPAPSAPSGDEFSRSLSK
tara:strand:+ start:41525 stop:42604 length:1080 start_codon:yes stop_codon:yes gene_type:complete